MRIQSEPAGVKEPSLHPAQQALPPWMQERIANAALKPDHNFTALRAARAKVEELAATVRTEAFTDWVRRCTAPAREPSEWTQARVLYDSYIDHAKRYGLRAADRALSVQELATETQWGRMMATLLPKKRRTAGFYYPLRVKRVR